MVYVRLYCTGGICPSMLHGWVSLVHATRVGIPRSCCTGGTCPSMLHGGLCPSMLPGWVSLMLPGWVSLMLPGWVIPASVRVIPASVSVIPLPKGFYLRFELLFSPFLTQV